MAIPPGSFVHRRRVSPTAEPPRIPVAQVHAQIVRVAGEELYVAADAHQERFDGIAGGASQFVGPIHGLAQAGLVDRGHELRLAREDVVERPERDSRLSGNLFHLGVFDALLGKRPLRALEDELTVERISRGPGGLASGFGHPAIMPE